MILTLLISTILFDEKLKNCKRKIHNLWFTCQFTTIIIWWIIVQEDWRNKIEKFMKSIRYMNSSSVNCLSYHKFK